MEDFGRETYFGEAVGLAGEGIGNDCYDFQRHENILATRSLFKILLLLTARYDMHMNALSLFLALEVLRSVHCVMITQILLAFKFSAKLNKY